MRQVRWLALLAGVLACSVAGCARRAQREGPADRDLALRVRALLDPATRDAALLELLRALDFDEGYGPTPPPDGPLRVRHVVQ